MKAAVSLKRLIHLTTYIADFTMCLATQVLGISHAVKATFHATFHNYTCSVDFTVCLAA